MQTAHLRVLSQGVFLLQQLDEEPTRLSLARRPNEDLQQIEQQISWKLRCVVEWNKELENCIPFSIF